MSESAINCDAVANRAAQRRGAILTRVFQVLESAGIESFLLGENTNSLLGAAFFAQLQVHRKDEEAALQILGSSDSELETDEDVKVDEGTDGEG